jgi:hypothetical protein
MDNSSRQNPPPGQQLLERITGFWVSQILGTLALLGVPDQLAKGPRPSDDVARETGAHADSLYRLMRAGVMAGILQEVSPRTFALTPMGELLRSDVLGSMRHMAIAMSEPAHWLPWGRLPEAIRTGNATAQAALGTSMWEYLASHPDQQTHFAQAMGGLTAFIANEVPRLHDFSRYARVADIGGSQGVLLEQILRAHSSCRGILFDLPDVIAGARARIEAVGLAGRVELVSGSFLEPVIPAAEAYLLKNILHDWDDAPSTTILRQIHRGAPADARLFIVEWVMPEDGQPSTVPLLDVNMLVLMNGRERTAREFEALLGGASWQLERITPAQSGVSLIEARRR